MDRISAFMDGEANPAEAQHTALRLKQEAECRETWQAFHLIGDVMRGDPLLRGDFGARFRARFEHEPTLLAPRITWRKTKHIAYAAAASVAAVAIVVGIAYDSNNPLNPLKPSGEIVEIASAPSLPQPVSAAYQGRVNQYLLAHQEFSPSSALQGVAPYVRTVSTVRDNGGQ